MSCDLTFYVDNSNVVELQSLTNSVTSVLDTGATVTVTLKRGTTEIGGQSWPASMSHVAAGTYRATLEDDVEVVAGREYIAIIDATGSGGEIGRWEATVEAATRRCE